MGCVLCRFSGGVDATLLTLDARLARAHGPTCRSKCAITDRADPIIAHYSAWNIHDGTRRQQPCPRTNPRAASPGRHHARHLSTAYRPAVTNCHDSSVNAENGASSASKMRSSTSQSFRRAPTSAGSTTDLLRVRTEAIVRKPVCVENWARYPAAKRGRSCSPPRSAHAEND